MVYVDAAAPARSLALDALCDDDDGQPKHSKSRIKQLGNTAIENKNIKTGDELSIVPTPKAVPIAPIVVDDGPNTPDPRRHRMPPNIIRKETKTIRNKGKQT